MTTEPSPAMRLIAFGIGAMLLMAGAVLLPFGANHSALAAPLCSVEISLPSRNTAELRPGESALFSYSAIVTAAEVHAVDLQVVGGTAPGLTVDVQPRSASAEMTPGSAPQTFPVSGRITVSAPASAAQGEYTVGGLGAAATCTTRERDGSVTTTMARDVTDDLSITVTAPVEPSPTPQPSPTPRPSPSPTPTPEPSPTNTPVPPLPTATPEPAATDTAVPSSTRTARPTSTASPTPTVRPSSTATVSPSPTGSIAPTETPVPAAAPGQSPVVEAKATHTSTVSSGSAPTSTVSSTPPAPGRTAAIDGTAEVDASPTATIAIAQSPVALPAEDTPVVASVLADSGATTLDWTENWELFASARESRNYGSLILGAVAAMLIAGGACGVWRSRSGST